MAKPSKKKKKKDGSFSSSWTCVPDVLFDRAAELRAGGSTWESVAAHVGRTVRTVMRWRVDYPERWAAAFGRAEQELVDHAAAESVALLRSQLRLKDEKIRASAAQKLLVHRQKHSPKDPSARPAKGPKPSPVALRIATYLENLSEEEHDRLLERMLPIAAAELDRRRAGRGVAGA